MSWKKYFWIFVPAAITTWLIAITIFHSNFTVSKPKPPRPAPQGKGQPSSPIQRPEELIPQEPMDDRGDIPTPNEGDIDVHNIDDVPNDAPILPGSVKGDLGWEDEARKAREASGSGQGPSLINIQRPYVPPEALKAVDWLPKEGVVPPFTREMQALIFAHQHPMNCVGKKFIVWKMLNSGLGNELHTLSWALANAINLNRILTSEGAIENKPWKYAGNVQPSSLDFYYQPLTNCSREVIEQSRPSKGIYWVGQGHGFSSGDELIGRFRRFGKSWWRAQAMRYFLRHPLPWWRDHLRNTIGNMTGNVELTGGLVDPLPRNLISIHVRMSDKKKEMKLKSLMWYLHYAEGLRRLHPELDTIFLSSEDGAVLKATEKFKPRWKFLSVPEDRADLNHEGFIRRFGQTRMMEISMINLHFHTQCDFFIAARLSNWCRLIDEMRLTNGKANRPMVWIMGTAALGQI